MRRTANTRMLARIMVLIIVLPCIASCVPPPPYSAKNEAYLRDPGRVSWKKVAILPFSGDPAFRRTSAEWFAFRVRSHGLFELIGPGIAEIELKEKGIVSGDADIPAESACAAGRALNADAVIVGSIRRRSYPGGIGLWPVAGVSVVDVSTGTVVATSVQPAKTMFAADMQTFAASATEHVVEDILPVLFAAAGRPWTAPKAQERPAETSGSMPW